VFQVTTSFATRNPSRRDHCEIAAELLSPRPSPGNDNWIVDGPVIVAANRAQNPARQNCRLRCTFRPAFPAPPEKLIDPHRLRIVQMLLGGRYTVGELAEACEIPSHMASEHLRLMQRCGLFDVEKEGRCVYYTIAEPHLANIMACIEARFGGPKSPRTGVSA
jgi:DNA-binding transcriptional ArsR family regulator